MFFKWLVSSINNEQALFLYLQNDYEFAKELFDKSNSMKMQEIIKDYINRNNIIYNGNKVYIVSNGLIIGYAVINNPNNLKVKSYVDLDKVFDERIELIDIADKKEEQKVQSKSIEEIEKRYILQNYNTNLEKETIKVILTILHSNLILELKKNGRIKDINLYYKTTYNDENIPLEYINRINSVISEIQQTLILTNNKHRKLVLFSSDQNYLNRINTMVKAGYNFKQIISHFFPKSSVSYINQ